MPFKIIDKAQWFERTLHIFDSRTGEEIQPSFAYYPNQGTVLTGNVFPTKKEASWSISLGNQVTGPLHFTGVEYTEEVGYFRVSWAAKDKKYSGNQTWVGHRQAYLPNWTWGSLGTTFFANQYCQEKFVRYAREKLTAVNGWTVLGELKETLHGIRHPADALFRSLREYVRETGKIRKRFKRNLRRAQKLIADLYLEYRFHWKPIASDIEGGIRALASKESYLKEEWVYQSNKGVKTESLPLINDGTYTTGLLRFTVLRSREESSTVRLLGSLGRRAPFGYNPVTERLGLTLDNFLPGVYNALPFTFLADYFTNIGQMLEAWSFQVANVKWLQRTVVIEQKQISKCFESGSVAAYSNPTIELLSANGAASVTMNKKVVDRQWVNPYEALVPDFEFQIPGVIAHYNIAALMASDTAGRKRFRGRGN